ncbi:MAG TPA: iron ABC transporter permease [Rhizomicrobium sp.]|nr:iron ABC transporter permease [Rhizomicrobium sp.]
MTDRSFTLILIGLLVLALIASMAIGAFLFSPAQMFRFAGERLGWLAPNPAEALDGNVFFVLRLPRVVLCGLTGATLGLSGAVMQGLFRNPIVEPGLAGTSAGAALGAASVFVLGTQYMNFLSPLGTAAVPLMAFAGAFAATMFVWKLSTRFHHTNVFTLLLAGIAVNAMCSAGTGFLSYIARDPQARSIAFWNLGTFTTADWHRTTIVAVVFVACLAPMLRHGKSLNALMLGEENAGYLGIDPEKLIFRLLLINTAMVAAATAMVGVIAFVGLVVPHLLRLMRASDYNFLLPASALLGALLMEVIDVVARVIIAPAELPIGIITALIGAPFFLWILFRQRWGRLDG